MYIIDAVRTPIGIGKPEVGDLYPVQRIRVNPACSARANIRSTTA